MAQRSQKMRRGRPPGHTSQYRTIAADLASRLTSGEWPIGNPIPSYRQLAQRHQVGIHVIQLALKELAAEGLVLIRPGRPPIAALGASLSAVMKNTIAIVLPAGVHDVFETPYRLAMIRGIAKSAQEGGYPFLVLQDTKRWRTVFPAGLKHLPLIGIILMGPLTGLVLQQYEKIIAPVVLLDQPGDKWAFHSIAVDNYNAAFDATSRIITHGHRRIVFIRTITYSVHDIDPDAKERHAGFLAACVKAGLRKEEYKVHSASYSNSQRLIKDILTKYPGTTAVLSDSNTIADVAEKAGLKIPRDLSIAAFQSKGQPVNTSGPQIDFELMGRSAVEVIRRKPATMEHLRIPTMWNEGKSIARVPVGRRSKSGPSN
jgi:GntR family transcriptional regulator of arabinose operon